MGLREENLKHKETLDMLEDARERLERVEGSLEEQEKCKEELNAKVKRIERLDFKIDDMEKEIQEKDERALALGKQLNDVRKQFNHARDESLEDVFKTSDKTEANNSSKSVSNSNNKQ